MISTESRSGIKFSPDTNPQKKKKELRTDLEFRAFLFTDRVILTIFNDDDIVTNEVFDETLIHAAKVLGNEEAADEGTPLTLVINLDNIRNGNFRVNPARMKEKSGYKVTLEGRLFSEIIVVTKDPYVISYFNLLHASNLANISIVQTNQQALDYLEKRKKI